MTTVAIRDLGRRGLRYDVQPADVPVGDLTEIKNARWRDGALSNMPALTSIHQDATNQDIRFSAPWNLDGGDAILIITATTWLLKRSGLADEDVTPVAYTDSPYWYADSIGDALIVTNGIDAPFWLQSGNVGFSPFVTLDGWPALYSAEVMIAWKGRLVALRVTKSGQFQPGMVKTSHPYSPGDLTTFWDFTDPQLRATEDQRQFGGRTLVGGARVRDSLLLCYDRGVETMQLAAVNDPAKVYVYRTLFEDDGMAQPHARAELPGFAVIMGRNDIYTTDGIQRKSLTDGRISQWLTRTVDYSAPIWVTYWARRNEIHVLLRTDESDGANINMIYSTEVDAWYRQDTTDAGGTGVWTQMLVASEQSAENPVWADYPTEVWADFQNVTWESLYQASEGTVLHAVVGDQLLDCDPLAPTGSYARRLFAENAVVDLDGLRSSVGDSIAFVNRLYPQVRCSTDAIVGFRVGSKANPNAGATLEPTVPFSSRDDFAADVRTAGRYLTLQIIEDPSNQTLFTVSGMDVELGEAGEQ